jgi:hypothetical protein
MTLREQFHKETGLTVEINNLAWKNYAEWLEEKNSDMDDFINAIKDAAKTDTDWIDFGKRTQEALQKYINQEGI